MLLRGLKDKVGDIMLYDLRTDIAFYIKRLEESQNGINLHIYIHIPMSYGWIDEVKFVALNSYNKMVTFNLGHVGNFEKWACFEGNAKLENHTLYGVCFSFKANGLFKYFKKKSIRNDQTVKFDECWFMQVGSFPKWIRGRIMYHIFVGNCISQSSMNSKDVLYNMCRVQMGNRDISVEQMLRELLGYRASVIYLTSLLENAVEGNLFYGMDDIIRNLCLLAHKRGMCVILDTQLNQKQFIPSNEVFNYWIKLGVDSIDTKCEFSQVMNNVNEAILM